jgi:ABC-type sugar transport system substrate-binding protein
MKMLSALLLVLLIATVMVSAPAAKDLKDKVKVEIESVGLHPGMDPGMYVCASGHLHIKGTVQNQADVPLRQVKVAGRAFDAAGKLLGTATTTTKSQTLAPGQRAEINLEFLTVTGPAIEQVKRHDVSIIEAPSL